MTRPEPLLFRPVVEGRRGGSCCGGRFSMRSHSIPGRPGYSLDEMHWVSAERPSSHDGIPHLNCSEDRSKVQGVLRIN